MKTLADLLANQASVSAHVAMLFADQVYTYADLEELSNQAAHALVAEGLLLGDVACQIVGSRPELIINLFGILKSGAIYAPLNPSLTRREMAAQLADCKPSIVIIASHLHPRHSSGPTPCFQGAVGLPALMLTDTQAPLALSLLN